MKDTATDATKFALAHKIAHTFIAVTREGFEKSPRLLSLEDYGSASALTEAILDMYKEEPYRFKGANVKYPWSDQRFWFNLEDKASLETDFAVMLKLIEISSDESKIYVVDFEVTARSSG